MAHDIATINGKAAMAYVGAAPWHGLGQEVPEEFAYDVGHFLSAANLDWEVETIPTYMKHPKTGEFVLMSTGQGVIRWENDKLIELASVGPRFNPLQNMKSLDFFQPFLETKSASLHTAGALDEGRRIWALAKLNLDNAEIRKGDEVEKYVLLSNSHDGSLAVRVGFTPIRVVCRNTLAMAHGDKASQLIRVRHTSKMHKNLENIRETMNLANQEFEATMDKFRFLNTRGINPADVEKYVKVVFNMPEKAEDMPTRTANILTTILNNAELKFTQERDNKALVEELIAAKQANDTAALDLILENMETKHGADIVKPQGTVWDAYNAVNSYLNHERGRTVDTRLNSLWFGDSAKVNKRALDIALHVADGKDAATYQSA